VEATFSTAATSKEHYPRNHRKWIVFSGRSNVGKSSLINSLLGRKNLARTSSTPGRTQTINFYDVGERWTFVDLPGYGFARVGRDVRRQWGVMVEEFLGQAEAVRLALLVVDVRHQPTAQDLLMRDYLRSHQLNIEVVATKIDKLPRSRRERHLSVVQETLAVPRVLPYSATAGDGRTELWKIIGEV
jgi:GTP-binding protein